MKEKVELVLNELIQIYLIKSEPLSSTKLKEMANLPFSASSIRSYLKELEKFELIVKEHFSSGSYPSVKAMKSFWHESLKDRMLDFESNLKTLSNELDIYIMIEMFENQMLIEVYNLNNKFIVLEFEKDEIVYKYDNDLYTLLNSLKGMLLDELKKYLHHIGLIKECKALKNLYTKECYNKKFIYKNNLDKYDENNLENIEKGMHFFKNYLLLRDIIYDKNVFKNFLIIGDVYTDFFAITKAKEGLNE